MAQNWYGGSSRNGPLKTNNAGRPPRWRQKGWCVMDKKVEVYNFWWQVWEDLDEESKEACRKELKEDYENALEDVKEDIIHYDGPDTSSIEDYIIGTVSHYVGELCGPPGRERQNDLYRSVRG